jgi:hypothetical protein
MKKGSEIETLVRRLEARLSGPRWSYLLNIIGGFLIMFIAAIQARGYLHDVWSFLERLKSGTVSADSFLGLEPTWFDAGLVSALIGIGALNIAVGFIALKSRDVEAILVHLYKEKERAEQGVGPN